MSDPKAQQEPSMEEILASIRRIISEDDEVADEQSEGADDEAVDADVDAEAQVEIAEVDDPVIEAVEPEPEPEPEAVEEEIIAEEIESIVEEAAEEAAPEDDVLELTELADDVDDAQPVDMDAGLVSSETEVEAATSLSKLSEVAAPAVTAALAADVGIGNAASLDEVVRQLLRPLLREWLDANLPAIVEDAVEQEVKRLARTYRGRG